MALISKLEAIGAAIRDKTGETDKYTLDEMPEKIEGIKSQPNIESITITENGTYTAADDLDGYSPIEVNVQPELEAITITDNGLYEPTAYGFSLVTVDVQSGDVPSGEGVRF